MVIEWPQVIVSFLTGCGLVGSIWKAVGYLGKRFIERHDITEAQARDKARIELGRQLLELHREAVETGMNLGIQFETPFVELLDFDENEETELSELRGSILLVESMLHFCDLLAVCDVNPEFSDKLNMAEEKFLMMYPKLEHCLDSYPYLSMVQTLKCFNAFMLDPSVANAEALNFAMQKVYTEPDEGESSDEPET